MSLHFLNIFDYLPSTESLSSIRCHCNVYAIRLSTRSLRLFNNELITKNDEI